MTTVSMDEPLPAIQIEIRARHREGTTLCAAVLRIDYEQDGKQHRERAVIAHLAQALAALTDEQLAAVVGALPGATRIRMLGPAAGALATFDYERADQEKARADRAIRLARAGWESARLLAICPPTFGAPATERAADEALAQIKELEANNG